ncbi:MAG: hypothetical protein L3J54_03965 [Draconibacterium sp.]|nr:hypothetical protein [Draconibacterium sp.]
MGSKNKHEKYNIINPEFPNVLLIGNSVMNGYKNIVIPGLKVKMNVDYWLTTKQNIF